MALTPLALTMMPTQRGSYPQVEPRAADLMTPAVALADGSLPLGAAAERVNRARARLLVTRESHGRGAAWSGIGPVTLGHALALGLHRAPLVTVLWRLPAVGPRTPEVLVRRRFRTGPPAVLVVDGGRVVGAVLREASMARALPSSLRAALERLPESVRLLLREAARIAAETDRVAWLVGGLVRDLALGRDSAPGDLDLVIEGHAAPVARRLAMRFGGRVREHPAFLTATLELPGYPRIDVATARREHYRRPGALPRVEPASIDDDLWRRDFSINALAVRLDSERWGETLDPTGGLDDLARRTIRILHPLSFVEDPTRCLRAGRFAARLGFRLEPSTRRLLSEAARLDAYEDLSADRLRAELGRVLAEPAPFSAVAQLRRLGALPILGVDSTASRGNDARLARLDRRTRGLTLSSTSREAVAILALGAGGGAETVDRIGRRLGLPAERLAAIRQARADAPKLLRRLAQVEDRAEAYRVLESAPEPSAAWALLETSSGRRAGRAARFLAQHLRQWRHLRPLIDGDDLQALHVTPGPRFRVLLREARAAQVSGRVRTRAGALGWLRQVLPVRVRVRERSRSRPRSEADHQGKGGTV